MYRCRLCQQSHEGQPIITPTGYYRDKEGNPTKNRLGEALLCSECFSKHKQQLDHTIEGKDGFFYAVLGRP